MNPVPASPHPPPSPAPPQVLLFSATLHSPEVRALADKICQNPIIIDLKGKDAVPETGAYRCGGSGNVCPSPCPFWGRWPQGRASVDMHLGLGQLHGEAAPPGKLSQQRPAQPSARRPCCCQWPALPSLAHSPAAVDHVLVSCNPREDRSWLQSNPPVFTDGCHALDQTGQRLALLALLCTVVTGAAWLPAHLHHQTLRLRTVVSPACATQQLPAACAGTAAGLTVPGARCRPQHRHPRELERGCQAAQAAVPAGTACPGCRCV